MRSKRYHTTNATLRQAAALFCVVGINLLFSETGRRGLFSVPAAALICFHSWLFGRTAAYMTRGIFASGTLKRVYALVFCLLFLPLGFLAVEAELTASGICAMVTAAAFCVLAYTPGTMNGDNARYSETDIDRNWFDRVDGIAYEMRVSFPADIGCCKQDRLEGKIEALGLARAGKYEGEETAMVASAGKRYMCPIKYLKPAEMRGEDGKAVIACNSSREVSFASWKNGEKVTGVFYVFGIGGA
jgi:hypothetical protein